jgi:hypothetical protein
MSREKIEKIIEKELGKIRSVEKFFIEKKDKEHIDVVVVSSAIDKNLSSKILGLEMEINKDLKFPSEFRVYQSDPWVN